LTASGNAPRAVAAHYEKAARSYSKRRSRGVAGVMRRREQAAVLALTEAGPGRRTLDVGCGDGEVAGVLIGRGARVVAVDIALAMADAARRRGAWAVRGDITALPLRSGFDEVVCIGSSEFVADLPGLAAGLAGCLRPGGSLVLLFPRRNWFGWALWLYHRIGGVRIRLRSRAAVASALVGAGFAPPERWRRCIGAWVCRARLTEGQ
jgi:SAM-dependent methyltransferase